MPIVPRHLFAGDGKRILSTNLAAPLNFIVEKYIGVSRQSGTLFLFCEGALNRDEAVVGLMLHCLSPRLS